MRFLFYKEPKYPYGQKGCTMFERFTEGARQVVAKAQEEARTLRHNQIGTEHILLGLLLEEEGFTVRVSRNLGITVERARAQVVRLGGSNEEATSGQLSFSSHAKNVLELALCEAINLGHNYIGPEHILLGLVRESEGQAMRLLLELGADSEKIRREVILSLSSSGNPSLTAPLTQSPEGKLIETALEGVSRTLAAAVTKDTLDPQSLETWKAQLDVSAALLDYHIARAKLPKS